MRTNLVRFLNPRSPDKIFLVRISRVDKSVHFSIKMFSIENTLKRSFKNIKFSSFELYHEKKEIGQLFGGTIILINCEIGHFYPLLKSAG